MVAKKKIILQKKFTYICRNNLICCQECQFTMMYSFFSVVDPDPYWSGSPGPVSVLGLRIRIQEQGNWLKLIWFIPFHKGFCSYVCCFMTYQLHKVSFSCKYFVTAKSDQDPTRMYPHGFSPGLIRNEVKTWIAFQCGSTALDFCSANWENNLARVGNILERTPHTGRQTYSPSSTLSAITSKREVNTSTLNLW